MTHRKFTDGAGFTFHCWECANSDEWRGDIGKCAKTGIAVGKYDSPNNGCSNAGGCGYYRKAARQ